MTVPQLGDQEGVSRLAFYAWRKKVMNQSHGGIGKETGDDRSHDSLPISGKFASVIVSAAKLPVAVRLPGEVCIEMPGDNFSLPCKRWSPK